MFYYKNDLSLFDKYKYIYNMINSYETKCRIQYLKINSMNQLMIKIVIKYRLSLLISFIYYINSKRYLNDKNSI